MGFRYILSNSENNQGLSEENTLLQQIDQVEIDRNKLDRFLVILRKVKFLPFDEKVRLEELAEFKYRIDDE